jgi:hypothetical protein
MEYSLLVANILSAASIVVNNTDFKSALDLDGRVNSSNFENNFLELLKNNLAQYGINVIISKPRHWYDILIDNIPINLKLTKCKSADNAFNKKSLVFTINEDLDFVEKSGDINFNSLLDLIRDKYHDLQEVRNPKNEYHYLVINKDTGDILFKSILDIERYIPNSSGNIMQINWKNEFLHQNYKSVNKKEKMRELLKVVQKSEIDFIAKSKKFCEFTF